MAERTCAVDDAECVPGRLRRGMCEKHYRRAMATGSTVSTRIDNLTHYTVAESGCWEWNGALWRNGYGKTSRRIHGTRLAHRIVYIEMRGPIDGRLDLDHLCRNRKCVNPDHLEPVTRAVNIQRGVDARSSGYCHRGHDQRQPHARWTEPGTGRSCCRQCKALREKRRRQRIAA